MDHHTQYLAEEIAENCAAGQISRRDAMRHLGFLGLSAVSASALLAGCGDDDDETAGSGSQASTTAASTPGTTSGGPTTTGAPVATQNVTYAGNGITIQGVYAPATTPRGAVLVIHENRGITDFVRTFTGKLAGSGYSALAVDLLSAQGGTASFTDPATIGPALTENATNRSVGDMKASLEELARRVPNQKLGAVGFCFGGSMVWELLKAGEPPALAAAAPFYGTPGDNPDFSKSKAAVFAVYGETDTRVNATRETAKAALDRARLTNEQKTYPGVGHAFMTNGGANYNEAQATAAYNDLMNWFGRYLR